MINKVAKGENWESVFIKLLNGSKRDAGLSKDVIEEDKAKF